MRVFFSGDSKGYVTNRIRYPKPKLPRQARLGETHGGLVQVGRQPLALRLAVGAALDRSFLERQALGAERLRRSTAKFARCCNSTAGVRSIPQGDGFLAAFDGPARGIRAALAIVTRVATLGLSVRAGLHTGECEVMGEKLPSAGRSPGSPGAVSARSAMAVSRLASPSSFASTYMRMSVAVRTNRVLKSLRPLIKKCYRPRPAGRAGFDLVREARHCKSMVRQLLEVAQLLHVTIGNLSARLVALPDD